MKRDADRESAEKKKRRKEIFSYKTRKAKGFLEQDRSDSHCRGALTISVFKIGGTSYGEKEILLHLRGKIIAQND